MFEEDKVHPDLRQLINISDEMPAYGHLVEELKQKDGDVRAVVLEAAKPYLISALQRRLQLPVLVVTAQPENGKKLHEQLSTWLNSSRVKLFLEPDALPYERIASNVATELERVDVLSILANYMPNKSDPEPPLIVTSAPALMAVAQPAPSG